MSMHHPLPYLLDKCWRWGTYTMWPVSPPKSGPAVFLVLFDSTTPPRSQERSLWDKDSGGHTLSQGNNVSIRQAQYVIWPAFWVGVSPRFPSGRRASNIGTLARPCLCMALASSAMWLNIKHTDPPLMGTNSQAVTQQEKRIRKTRASACLWWVWHMGSMGFWDHLCLRTFPVLAKPH